MTTRPSVKSKRTNIVGMDYVVCFLCPLLNHVITHKTKYPNFNQYKLEGRDFGLLLVILWNRL